MRGVAARPLSTCPMRAGVSLSSNHNAFFRLQTDPECPSWDRFTHFFPERPMSTLSRREFLAASAVAATVGSRVPLAAAEEPAKFKLGTVTYNVPKDWDLPTLLKVCREVGIAAVECRTTHKHGVEPSLSPSQRKDVKKQFADAGVVFWGCGSVCEFQSTDTAVVKKNIEECKRFVDLVKDIGGHGVKVRPNGLPKGADPQKTFEQIGKALIECGRAADAAG